MSEEEAEPKVTPDGNTGRVDYVQEFGPVPMTFEDYAASANEAFTQLVSRNPAEAEIQLFLEGNPAFVPGAWTPSGNSGHPPWNQFLITQPVLPGLTVRRPDFMWIAQHSDTWFPTLIEIETPSKRLFRGDRQPTADFTQARTQITQWKAWFASPENVMKFIQDYGLKADFVSRRMKPSYILVFGRREEFASSVQLTQIRAEFMADDEEIISFDRLMPASQLEDAITVSAGHDNKWRARAVAPTFGLIPPSADRLLVVDGLEEVIKKTEGIGKDRADFLVRRIEYWRRWAVRQSGMRVYDPWKRE